MSSVDQNNRWFFLEDRIHKTLAINRAKNYVKAYDYVDGRVKMYPWDETRKNKQRAFRSRDVAKFVNRSDRTIRYYINEGLFVPTGAASRSDLPNKVLYFFTPQDVMDLREAIAENSRNAQRPLPLPTRDELRTMVRTGSLLYIKDGDSFVPVWESKF